MPERDETQQRPRVALICHHDAPLHFEGLARWIASWATLTAIVIVQEPDGLRWKRLKRERRRVGLARLAEHGAVEATERPHQRRLAGPVCSQHRDAGAIFD